MRHGTTTSEAGWKVLRFKGELQYEEEHPWQARELPKSVGPAVSRVV
jgi:hypothetical protein